MEKIVVYIYRNINNNVHINTQDNSLLKFDREKASIIGYVQNSNQLDHKNVIRNKFGLSNFEFKQENLWNLILKRNKYNLLLLDVEFKNELYNEDKDLWEKFLKNDISISNVKTIVEEYTEISQIDFRYNSIVYSLLSTGILTVITELNQIEKDVIIEPILYLLGIKNNVRRLK